MEKTTTAMKPDLPQLRQIVLENSKRIDRNEMMIDQMRLENDEESRKRRERDEWWEESRKEHAKRMRSIEEHLNRATKLHEEFAKGIQELNKKFEATDKRIEENRQKIEEQIKKNREESDKRIEEHRKASDKRIEEIERQIRKHREETDRQIKENRDATFNEIRGMFKETNASISRISKELLGVTGHIIEGLVSSSTEKIFKKAGFDFHNSCNNVKREIVSENKKLEVDVILENDEAAVPIEVKADFTVKKVKRFLHKMTMFRQLFPEYADKIVYAAVVAINYEEGADALAHEEGLLVIRVNSDDVFSLDPVDKKQLRKF